MLPPRSYIFIGLNVIRALSIVALILVFSSSIFVMVKDVEAVNTFQDAKQAGNTTATATAEDMLDCDYIMGSSVPNQAAGIFWAILNRLLIIFQVIILFLSELGWPASFFERFFPVLGPGFGLGALGVFQCLIGAAILSHHVDDFTLVAAFFLFSLGCVNILIGLIFRESAKTKRALMSWKSEAKSVLPSMDNIKDVRARFPGPFSNSNSSFGSFGSKAEADEFATWKSGNNSIMSEKAGYGFGRQGEKAAGLKGFLISKPVETLPRYMPTSSPPRVPVRPPSLTLTQPSRYSIGSDR